MGPAASMSSPVEEYSDGQKIIAARPRGTMAALAGGSADRRRAQSAGRYRLSGALCGAGIHLDLPGHRTAGFCASGDRLCAGKMAAGVEVVETLCRELPQSRRIP